MKYLLSYKIGALKFTFETDTIYEIRDRIDEFIKVTQEKEIAYFDLMVNIKEAQTKQEQADTK